MRFVGYLPTRASIFPQSKKGKIGKISRLHLLDFTMSSTKERVTHILDPTAASHIPLFLPRISVTRGGGGGGGGDDENEDVRPFQSASDIDRVMDYPNMPDPPPECVVMHCEAPGSGIDDGNEDEVYDGGIVFPKRSAKLSGGYIFLSKPKDPKADASNAADGDGGGSGGKIVCIPLQGCKVEFPPGGRRVFREHAHTGKMGHESFWFANIIIEYMFLFLMPSASSCCRRQEGIRDGDSCETIQRQRKDVVLHRLG